jgi:hypothetical protein
MPIRKHLTDKTTFGPDVQKNELATRVAAEGRFPMKTIADVPGVARSHLHELVHRPTAQRHHYRKAADEFRLLPPEPQACAACTFNSSQNEARAAKTLALLLLPKRAVKPVGSPVSVCPEHPECRAGRLACRHRIRRSPAAPYTKRRCQGWFGSFLGSGRARADDGRVRYGVARVRFRRGHHRFSR